MRSSVLAALALVLTSSVRAQSSPAPDISLRGNTEDNGFGYSIASGGDVNGDGFTDLVVGADGFSGPVLGQGRVFVFYGPVGPNVSFSQADATMTGEALLDGFGNSVAGAGDVNNDGFDDVLVGARSNDTAGIQAGRVYLFYGPLAGERPAQTADAIISGEAFDELGWSLTGAGDTNADGFDDILLGAWLAGNGKAVLFNGPVAGPRTISQADASIEGVEFNEQLGEAVTVADLNLDGRNDLVVGAPRPPLNGQGTGRAYVFFSPVSGHHPATDADVIIHGEAINDEFGTAVAGVGDVNGDGAEDLVVGAHQLFREGDGRAYVFFGPLPAGNHNAVDAGAILLGEPPVAPEEEDLFGESVSRAGDANGDGVGDFVVGASNNRVGGIRAGRAYVFHGPIGGTVPAGTADRIITGSTHDLLGTSLAAVGDLNADGADEVMVGAPGVFESGVTEYAGVYFGHVVTGGEPHPTRPPAVLSQVIPTPAHGSARFALTLSRPGFVQVEVLDLTGRRVLLLFSGAMASGETRWFGLDTRALSRGAYMVRAGGGDLAGISRLLIVE